ncbi:helix-turn-helix domain-containing protein [Rubrivirga sp.]|uniref:helix-turn-helix domain-containing protein n=1 Tax=Rubrivirga sp. TaxID=1885344 RepID=UPI003B52975A
MPSTTYVARRPGPFSALVQASEIGGLRLDPHPPVRVLDRVYDTDDGELLRRGLTLRVREREGTASVTLRPVGGGDAPSFDLDVPAGEPGDGPLRLPPGALADAVRAAVGDDPLRPLLTLRQYRTPRAVHDGDRVVGALSFDVVVYEVAGARVVSNEIEAEAADADVLAAFALAFQTHGLEPTDRPKVARGLRLVRRTLAQPALVLPDEVRRLEVAVDSDPDPSVRRRARVVLLDARGFRPDTIASQTGLSMARVQHWRERFREVRLGMLDPDPAPVAPRTPRPSERRPADDAPPPLRPVPDAASEPPPGRPEGDGVSVGEPLVVPPLVPDMASLLDLFSPTAPDTPFFDGHLDDAEDPDDAEGRGPQAPATDAGRSALGRQDRYPVVLGPVAPERVSITEEVADEPPAFVDVDLSRLRRARPLPAPRPSLPPSAGAVRAVPPRPLVDGGAPLLEAAEVLLAHAVAAFDAQAERFLGTRAPSDARRLLVAAHGVRLTVETVEPVLPTESARRLVAGLRPLVADLDTALDTARAALAADGRADLVRRTSVALATAADRLDGVRESWSAQARRLVARLAAQSASGVRRSDDAPLGDDFVGAPGDAPSPTRLRHVLGSEVWRRFEDVLAIEDDLDAPTVAVASHLAVALSGLRFVASLVETPDRAVAAHLVAALVEAEAAVVAARDRYAAGDARALDGLAEVWGDVTSPSAKDRLAALMATI